MAGEDVVDDVRLIVPVERDRPCDELPKHHAQRPNVDAAAVAFPSLPASQWAVSDGARRARGRAHVHGAR